MHSSHPHSDSAQGSFPSIIVIEELLSAPVVHTAFKTVFDAIELAMIASSTALIQTCKRGAPSLRTVALSNVRQRFWKGSLCQQCEEFISRSASTSCTAFKAMCC